MNGEVYLYWEKDGNGAAGEVGRASVWVDWLSKLRLRGMFELWKGDTAGDIACTG